MKNIVTLFKEQSFKAKLQFIFVFGLILFAIIISFFLVHKNESIDNIGNKENKLLVDVVKVFPKDISLNIVKTGTVEARNYISIIPEVSGRVISVNENFRDGSSFEANEKLFKIESIDYQLNVDKAHANLKQAETNLLLSKADSDSAKAEWKALHPNKKVPSLVARTPQLEQAKANLKSAQAQLEDAKLDFSRTEFSLPYSGKVINANVEVGQYLKSGSEYGKVYTNQSIEILVPIEKEYLSLFKANSSKAKIHLSNKVSVNGIVSRIGLNLDEQTRFGKIYIKPNKSMRDKLIPGTFVKTNLIAPQEKGLWKIPNSSLQDAESIWIVTKNNTLKKYIPEILSIEDDFSIVRGTKKEVLVVTSMVVGASDGMSVKYE